MGWRYPADDRFVPAGGEFLSMYTDKGPRSLPHSGLDYSRHEGSPIYAIGPGTVVARGTNARAGWGYHVWIDHGDVGDGRHAYSYYAHMEALGPKVGTKLKGGEVIGHIGASGSGITGAHLHWGVALARPADLYKVTLMNAASRDYLVDPAAFVAQRITNPAGGDITPLEPDISEEDDMNIRVISHVSDGKTEEVALVCPEFDQGYKIAKGGTPVALGWLRMYSPRFDGTPHQKLNRDQYLGAIDAAKATRAAYLAGLPTADTTTGGGSAGVDLAPVVAAIEKLGSTLGVKIEALPAEIDAYSDGRK